MMKKMMLLAVSVAALAAFVVPAAAQASLSWSEEGEIQGHGTLTSISAAGFSTGPAPVTFSGVVGGTEGLITEFTIGGAPLATNAPGCTATGTAEVGEGWSVSLSTPDTMTIENVRFTNDYNASPPCPLPFATVEGDVTLTVNTPGNSASANPYEDFETLSIVAPAALGGVDITGGVTWTGPTIVGLP